MLPGLGDVLRGLEGQDGDEAGAGGEERTLEKEGRREVGEVRLVFRILNFRYLSVSVGCWQSIAQFPD